MRSIPNVFRYRAISLYRNVKMHSDEQHAMSSHELQSALMVTVELSKMQLNCTNFVTWTINTGIRNSTQYLFLINKFGIVQWNISISETVRNRTHVHNFLFKITDNYELSEYWSFLLGHPVCSDNWTIRSCLEHLFANEKNAHWRHCEVETISF
jgi:hypothetical protein